jgi:WD40 repeat protein
MSQPTPDRQAQTQDNLIKETSVGRDLVFAPVQIGTKIETQILQISRTEVTHRPLIKTSPYQGLERFNVRDHDRFFGRDKLVAELIKRVHQSSLTVVLGASGSGKSSVVRAGLIPELKKSLVHQKIYDFIFTPNQNPFDSLYRCLLSEEKAYRFRESEARIALQAKEDTLTQTIKILKKDEQYWLFFVDQFEELFTICDSPNERNNFIEGLVRVAKFGSSSVKIVLAMRSDFLEQFSFYTELGNIASQNNMCVVTEMFRDELRQAIEAPAAKHGVVFEEQLVDQIINEVEGQKGYLPLLQYTLDSLWQIECKTLGADSRPHIEDRTLNKKSYTELEGVRGALQKRVNEIYSNLNQDTKAITKQVFLKLVNIVDTDSGSKAVSRRAYRDEFVGESVEEIVSRFIDEKLLVSSSEYLTQKELRFSGSKHLKQTATVEIGHEILISSWDELRGWLDEEKEAIILKHWLAGETNRWQRIRSEDEFKARNELLKGSRLAQAVDFRQKDAFKNIGGLRPEEEKFIDASVAEVERVEAEARRIEEEKQEQKQRELKQAQELAEQNKKIATQAKRFAIGSSGAVVIVGALLIATFFQWNNAQRRSILASAESARANLLANRPLEGTIDGVKAVRLLDNPLLVDREAIYSQVSDALIWANSEVRERLKLQGVDELKFSPNSKLIATEYRNPSEIVTLQSITGKQVAQLEAKEGVDSVQFSPDSKFLVVNSQGSDLHLWDTSGHLLKKLPEAGQMTSGMFSPDSKIFATSDSKTTKLWNASGELLRQHPGRFKEFAEYPTKDGRKYILITQVNTKAINTTKLWNMDGSHARSIPGEFKQIDAKKNIIITTQKNNSPKLWNLLGKPIYASVPGTFQDFAGTTLLTFDDKSKVFHFLNILDKSRRVIPYTREPKSVKLSPDGKFFLTAGSEQNATLWSVKLWAISRNPITQKFAINRPFQEASPTGVYPYFNSDGKSITLYPIGRISNFPALVDFSGQNLIATQADNSIDIKVLKESSRYLATARKSNFVELWDLGGNLIAQFKNFQGGFEPKAEFSPDNQLFATITPEGTMQLWNLSNDWGTLLPKNQFDSQSPHIEFSPDGRFLVYYTKDSASITLWDILGKTVVQLPTNLEDIIYKVKFSPNGQVLAIKFEDNLKLWNISEQSFTKIPGSALYHYFDFSLDGKQIVSQNKESIKIFDVASGRLVKEFTVSSEARLVGFSRKGEIVMIDGSNEKNSSVQRWNTSGKLIQSFNTGQKLGDTDLSPDTNLLASLAIETDEPFVRFWNISGDVIAPKLPGTLEGFSLNSKLLATFDRKKKAIYLWDTNGKLVLELPGHQSRSYVSFSADSKLVVVVHGDGSRSVWDISGHLIANLSEMQSGIKAVGFSPADRKLLATLGNDGTIKLLRLDDRNTLLRTACNQILAYLQSPAVELSESDRRLCDGIATSP